MMVDTYADEIHTFGDGEEPNNEFQENLFRKIQELDHDPEVAEFKRSIASQPPSQFPP